MRKTVKLTAARAQWAASRGKPPQFTGHALRNPAGVESRYVEALQALVTQMTAQVNREVLRLFKSEAASAHFGQDAALRGDVAAGWRGYYLPPMAVGPNGNARCVQPDPLPLSAMDAANIGSQARIVVNDLQNRFNALFAKKAGDLARNMADGAVKASQTALHGSLAKLTGGLSLKTSLMTPELKAVYNAAVAQNVGLIKTIAQEYLHNVGQSVMRSITTGNGLQDLVPDLQKFEGYTHRKATNVALDQTRKTYNAVNKGRMTAIGVKRFLWIHSGGGAEPRPLHQNELAGNVFSFDNPPVIDERTGERGIPGQAINCRCTMAPVFDFSDTDKPEKNDTSDDDAA